MDPNNININGNNNLIFKILDSSGRIGNKILDTGLVFPALLGAAGGWLSGVGTSYGFVQGLSFGIARKVVFLPFSDFISNTHDDEISKPAKNFWTTASLIACITIPILLTLQYGETAASVLEQKLPQLFWSTSRDYTFMKGISIAFLPGITEVILTALREQI